MSTYDNAEPLEGWQLPARDLIYPEAFTGKAADDEPHIVRGDN